MRLTYDHILGLPQLVGTEIRLDVTPCPKPRMTQRDRWKKRPSVLRYRAFKDALRAAWPEGVDFPRDVVIVRFNLPMPKSWSGVKRKRHDGAGHMAKPDVDNLVKALFDAAMVEDKSITTVMAEKRWAEKGSIQIVVYKSLRQAA